MTVQNQTSPSNCNIHPSSWYPSQQALMQCKLFTPKAEDRFLGPLMLQVSCRPYHISSAATLGSSRSSSELHSLCGYQDSGFLFQRVVKAGGNSCCNGIKKDKVSHVYQRTQQPNVVPASAHLPLHGTNFIFSPFWSQALLHSKL
jgi:hypothetical protein